MCTYTEKDLPELLRLLHDARASWESIATQLGLSQGDVEAISKKFDDPKDCFRESLKLWLRGVDPKPTREQLTRALQSPPVGRGDIAQQVVPGLSKLSKSPRRRDSKVCSSLLITVLALIMIVVYMYWNGEIIVKKGIGIGTTLLEQSDEVIKDNQDKDTSFPGKYLSLPVLKQELIGREEEMRVILDYFSSHVKVDLVTLYGQAGFGKSEIALHVGHRMLDLGFDVHYIRVENFVNVESLEKELMEISDKSYTSKGLVKWAQDLTKKTLLILDNVDGKYWVDDMSCQQLKELFLNPLLDNTHLLQVLITSQQDMMTKHAYRSYRLYSLSIDDCVCLMVNHSRNAESESDTADFRVICDLVGNVPFASKVLAKTLCSGNSAKHIIQRLSKKSKLKIIADKADKVGKDKILSAIELAFQFVRPECQINIFLLIKFEGSFTLEKASHHIISDVMSMSFHYTDFDFHECLLELTLKSFLESSQYNYFLVDGTSQEVKLYHFHELIEDYIKNSEQTEILQAYWKYRLSSGIAVDMLFLPDDNDFVALTQILHHDDSFSFEASIALMLNFPQDHKNLEPAARVLVSHCEVGSFNYTITRINTLYIIQGYYYFLEYVMPQEEFTIEWNRMDVISLCLPLTEVFDPSKNTIFSDYIVWKCLEIGSSHNICDSIWKHSLYIFAYESNFLNPCSACRYFLSGLRFYSCFEYDKSIHDLHLALEDTSSPNYDFMTYMTLYAIYSKQDNLTGMEESLAGIHKLDFQQINITCYTYNADYGYEDPHVTTAILFLQQVNETKLANKLRSKLFVVTYAKMGCYDLKLHLLNSPYHNNHYVDCIWCRD